MHKKHSSPLSAAVAFALFLLANNSARADLIPWGYNWQPSTTHLNANAGGSAYLKLTNEHPYSATGSSNTVITNIQSVSTAPYDAPGVFSRAPISFTLTLTDFNSSKSDNLTFSGAVTGAVTGDSSNVQLSFTSPTTQIVTLGGDKYTVTVGTYTPPGPPGESNYGGLNAFVTVTQSSSGGGGISSVPEPATLTLAGLAVPCLGLVCSGRKRRAKRCAA
jgi:hypothetical protein